MSEYGADEKPDLNLAMLTTKIGKLLPHEKSNVMQWSYADGSKVQKYACRKDHSNLLVKFES